MKAVVIPSGPLGVNTYIVVDESSGKGFILDPGGWNSDMKEKVISMDMDPEYIILTHGHADHIMGIPNLTKDFPDIRTVAYEDESDMLSDADFNMSAQFGFPTSLVPDITVGDGEHLKVGELDIEFLFTPGHTPGGMCVYIGSEGILFSGDTLFQASIGRTDFPGSSFATLEKAIHDKLWALPDETKVYPGHMGPTTIGYEKENNPFV